MVTNSITLKKQVYFKLAEWMDHYKHLEINFENHRSVENHEALCQMEDKIKNMVQEYMPSGCGFDIGTTLDFERSNGNKLVFDTAFHHMNSLGCYTEWTSHSVTVKPSFVTTFTITVSGRNKSGIKEYIWDTFYEALIKKV